VPEEVLFHIVVYANKYITYRRKEPFPSLVVLLSIATLVAVKFWNDSGVDNSLLARIVGKKVASINRLERRFLQGIGYELYPSPEMVDQIRSCVVAS